jgi:tetratricopeptide (TPR) repeat protein
MGIFRRLFRWGTTNKESDIGTLHAAVFQAATFPKRKRLEKMCVSNRELIADNFKSWATMPTDAPATEAQINSYGYALVAIAESFQRLFGDSSLIRILKGDDASNPLVNWQRDLTKAQSFIGSGDYASASEVLESALIDGSKLQGMGVDVMLAQTWGTLGFCYFNIGKLPEALLQTERALGYCRTTKDLTGIRAYLKNLCQIYTRLGRSEEAAKYAQELLLY